MGEAEETIMVFSNNPTVQNNFCADVKLPDCDYCVSWPYAPNED